MKLEFDEDELVYAIAEKIISSWDAEVRSKFYRYTEIGISLEQKIDKIISENKEKIIKNATELCAEKISHNVGLMAVLAALGKK